MMRQTRKQILTIALLALACVGSLAMPSHAASVVTRIVTNPLTGIAIDGFDPVSYFTEDEPLPGQPDNEYYWGGVPWYFANAANREIFVRAPDIYAPQFGGHGSMGVARGYLSDGNSRLYLLFEHKLYLFYSAANREAFALSPQEAVDRAQQNWPGLSESLSIN